METCPMVFGVMEGDADGRGERGGIVGVRWYRFFPCEVEQGFAGAG